MDPLDVYIEYSYSALREHEKVEFLRILRTTSNIYLGDGTIMHHAAKEGELDVVNTLIENGNPALFDRDGNIQTPLHIAIEYGNIKVAIALIETGKSQLFQGDGIGATPLHYSVPYIEYGSDENSS